MRSSPAWLVMVLSGLGCGQITERTVMEAESGTGASSGHGAQGQGGNAGSAPVAGGQAGFGGAIGVGGKLGAGGTACDAVASPAPLRALSNWEYRRSVETLTGAAVVQALPSSDPGAPPFDVSMRLDSSTLEALFAVAEAQGPAARVSALQPCDSGSADIACARLTIERLLTRVFRRPNSASEIDRYLALFQVASAEDGQEAGLDAVVAAALLSPQFLYKAYLGNGALGALMLTPLTDFEVATKLSYLLTGAPPDEALLDAASNGGLGEPEGIELQAHRLLATPEFLDAAAHFHAELFQLDGLANVQAPELTQELRASMRGATDAFIAHIYGVTPYLVNLLTSRTGYVDVTLAPHLNFAVQPKPGFWEVQFHPTTHVGLLTQAAVMTRFSNPTQRGLLVRSRLLCMEVPPPPPSIIPDIVIQPGQTRRDAWEQHRSNAVCAGCHELMDPIGYAFETFDELGRYRTTDNGQPIDTSGYLTDARDLDGPFDDPIELATRLSESPLVAECFTKNWWTYATQRSLIEADQCTITELSSAFERGGFDFRTLLVELVKHERFRLRPAFIAAALPEPSPATGSASGLAERRKLVLDFVLAELQWFLKRVPPDDQPLVDQHLTSLRELQIKLSNVQVGPGAMP